MSYSTEQLHDLTRLLNTIEAIAQASLHGTAMVDFYSLDEGKFQFVCDVTHEFSTGNKSWGYNSDYFRSILLALLISQGHYPMYAEVTAYRIPQESDYQQMALKYRTRISQKFLFYMLSASEIVYLPPEKASPILSPLARYPIEFIDITGSGGW